MTDEELITELDSRSENEISPIVERSSRLKKYRDQFSGKALDTYRENHPETAPDPAKAAADRLARKESILSLAADRGVDHRRAYQLLGVDDEELDDGGRLDLLVEFAEAAGQTARDQILKDHTRNPVVSRLSTDTPDEYVLEHSEQFPPDIVNAALDRGMAKDREKRTLRHVMGGR